MYRHILVAVDLLDSDIVVLTTAVNIAASYHSTLSVIHICEAHVTGYGEATCRHHIANEMQIKQQRYPQLKAMLDRAMPDSRMMAHCDTHLLFGRPADTIHHYAQKHHCDLIVVGGHGYSGIKALLGSTATKVLHGADCDVYTVHITDSLTPD